MTASTEITPRACVDCCHYSNPKTCCAKQAERFDVIFGTMYKDARDMRRDGDAACGPEGKLWEPRKSDYGCLWAALWVFGLIAVCIFARACFVLLTSPAQPH